MTTTDANLHRFGYPEATTRFGTVLNARTSALHASCQMSTLSASETLVGIDEVSTFPPRIDETAPEFLISV